MPEGTPCEEAIARRRSDLDQRWLAEGKVPLAIGQHVYSGTVTGVVKGTQYTVSFADSSRLIAGQESFEGSVEGRQGTATLTFRGSRPCFPTCPVTVHITSASGAGDLKGLQLDLTAIGGASLNYSGTYAFDGPQEEGNVPD
jgi:hypothetical protein